MCILNLLAWLAKTTLYTDINKQWNGQWLLDINQGICLPLPLYGYLDDFVLQQEEINTMFWNISQRRYNEGFL